MFPDLLTRDKRHLWHPYSPAEANPLWAVTQASGCQLQLSDGRWLIDGIASWWSVIHGYNHPVINAALTDQVARFSHVMFGGLTHEPAIALAERLVAISPAGLSRVFFSDSGSIAVEVALKMAQQYWQARSQPAKRHFVSFEGGYHGDTVGTSQLFGEGSHFHRAGQSPIQSADPRWIMPVPTANGLSCEQALAQLDDYLSQHAKTLAGVIIEPLLQAAGGMRIHSPAFLAGVAKLAQAHALLLIADEVATGFGRTGSRFACDQASVTPDMLCLGKALTGGYVGLAATLCQDEVAETISQGGKGRFMHGPTFMANPLACNAALASLSLLGLGADGQGDSVWQPRVNRIEAQLQSALSPLKTHPAVADVRILGAMGAVIFHQPIRSTHLQTALVDSGVWLRPFGQCLYTMPPYVISKDELTQMTRSMTLACDWHADAQSSAPNADTYV